MITEIMNDLANLPTLAENITLLLFVILVKSLITKFITHEPFRFFRFYCLRLADKVNNAKNSQQQQQVAGLIAALITLLPIVAILSLFETLIEVALIWQGLLLYLALGAFGINKLARDIAQAVVVHDKSQAKQLLSTQVLRDTGPLSLVGVSKACIEMLLLRSIQQQFVVVFIFLIVGPLGALSYRLLLEMHYSWNIKKQNFQYFGKTIHRVVNYLQWLPVRLFLCLQILITVNHPIVLYWQLVKKHFFKNTNCIVIHYLAHLLTVKLGGVAMYNLQKLRRASFNEQGQQPQAQDIITATQHIVKVQIFALSLLVVILLTSLLIN